MINLALPRLKARVAVLAVACSLLTGCQLERGPFELVDVLERCVTLSRSGDTYNGMLMFSADVDRDQILKPDGTVLASVGDRIVVTALPKMGDYPRTCDDGATPFILVGSIATLR